VSGGVRPPASSVANRTISVYDFAYEDDDLLSLLYVAHAARVTLV
jgi:hypothetical protein